MWERTKEVEEWSTWITIINAAIWVFNHFLIFPAKKPNFITCSGHRRQKSVYPQSSSIQKMEDLHFESRRSRKKSLRGHASKIHREGTNPQNKSQNNKPFIIQSSNRQQESSLSDNASLSQFQRYIRAVSSTNFSHHWRNIKRIIFGLSERIL